MKVGAVAARLRLGAVLSLIATIAIGFPYMNRRLAKATAHSRYFLDRTGPHIWRLIKTRIAGY